MQENLNYIILAKISSLRYLKDIQAGKLYMNNLKFYVDLEKNSGKQGIGDLLEASLINIKRHKLFIEIDGEEKKEIPIGPPPGIIYDTNALYHPVFCLMIKEIDLQNVDINQWQGNFQISEEEVEDFADNTNEVGALVIFDVLEFLNRIKLATNAMNIEANIGRVRYRDKRLPELSDQGLVLDNTFTKDLRFKKQSEFRIELLVHQDAHMILDIGSIHDISYIIEGDKITSATRINFQMDSDLNY
ncbi:hypothetical protein [Lysinibacillus sphaericus]|uniref:hypothetical protein n=1 Tax=Lysinibacillus sphaericus TaxID=1421 RepID=UPI003D7F9EBA